MPRAQLFFRSDRFLGLHYIPTLTATKASLHLFFGPSIHRTGKINTKEAPVRSLSIFQWHKSKFPPLVRESFYFVPREGKTRRRSSARVSLWQQTWLIEFCMSSRRLTGGFPLVTRAPAARLVFKYLIYSRLGRSASGQRACRRGPPCPRARCRWCRKSFPPPPLFCTAPEKNHATNILAYEQREWTHFKSYVCIFEAGRELQRRERKEKMSLCCCCCRRSSFGFVCCVNFSVGVFRQAAIYYEYLNGYLFQCIYWCIIKAYYVSLQGAHLLIKIQP